MDRGSQLDEEDEEDDEEEDDEKEEDEDEEDEEEATDIKSNNPHLAGGGKNDFEALFKRIFRRKITSAKMEKLLYFV